MTFTEIVERALKDNQPMHHALMAIADELDRRAAGNQIIAGAGDQYRRFRNHAVKSGDD